MEYFTLSQKNSSEYETKRSRFIAICSNVESKEQAHEELLNIKRSYPDARHHCWAYLLGSPFQPRSMASSDDGEPCGTAGKPILNVLQHNDIGNIMIIVLRYFGGVKLGAGGLVRAYSTAAQQVLEGANKVAFVEMMRFDVSCDFAQEQYLRHMLNELEGRVIKTDYQDAVTIKLELPQIHLDEFLRQVGLQQWKYIEDVPNTI